MGDVQYARVGDASIAYRVFGEEGPPILEITSVLPGILAVEHPATRHHWQRISRFVRPVLFDAQGSGRSDPLPPGVAASSCCGSPGRWWPTRSKPSSRAPARSPKPNVCWLRSCSWTSSGRRSALAIERAVEQLALETHSGIHVGDIERRGDDVGGSTVNIAARVMATAGRREVLVTTATYEAAAGSAIHFSPAGPRRLKGLSEPRQLYRVERSVPSQAREP